MHMQARVLALLGLALQLNSQQRPANTVDYRRDIQPILSKSCVQCHAGNAAPAELKLDTPEGLLRGGTSGAAVVRGNAEQSQLVVRIADTNANNRMPPPPNAPLSAQEIAVIAAWINQGAKTGEATVDFATQVQPIFQIACYSCHSGNSVKGGLHLDVKSEALKGGALGRDIVPGNSQDSLLLHRVLGDNGLSRMPMTGTPLTAPQIATLRTWLDQGAAWPDTAGAPKHWAYSKPARPALPSVKDSAWVKNSIDRFVLAKLEQKGLKPSPQAPKETLVRRLYLDAIGLPPSPAEVDQFVNDQRPDAYERLVDNLLANPHFGERWATKWLDLARYGDSDGYEKDRQRPGAYPYRDWVIKAFNANMPFDQFTIEQLAGDLLLSPVPQRKNWVAQETNDPKIATGFVRSSMLNTEGGTDPEEQNWVAQSDRATTVGNVWLGSTTQCTQCHNHKYDPFTQKQFYQMVAFFNNAKFGGPVFIDPNDPDAAAAAPGRRSFNEGTLELPTPEQAKTRDALRAELRTWQAKLSAVTPEFQKAEADWEQAVLDAEKSWQPLRPTRLESTGGSTLTLRPDASILASGKNPDLDTYILEAKSTVNGAITGLRIEALPDPGLPQGGPGRDYYGNFQMTAVSIEHGPSPQRLSKADFVETASDDMVTRLQNKDQKVEQIWRVDATRDGERKRRQLVIVAEQPFKVTTSDTLRISLTQVSEYLGVAIGNFRISVTTAADPKKATEVPHDLRQRLNTPREQRPAAVPAAGGRGGRSGGNTEDPLMRQWRTVAPELADVRAKIAALNAQIAALQIPSAPVLSEDTKTTQPTAFVRERGAFVSKAEEVQADVPAFLGALPADAPKNRLGLAEWLVNGENPLTARVRVNQMWETVFGMGIVETAEDFGTQGFPPSHGELLDFLATEFQSKAWDQKAIIRLMLTSNTYRQSSKVTPQLLELDPRNALLARGPRFRAEAEMIRDVTLSASGLMNLKMFGPAVMPRQPDGLWIFPYQPDNDRWIESKGADRYRRSMYIFIRRTVRYPSLTVFDAPSREVTVVRRSLSDTPLQALTALNDPAFFEAAQAMAKRIVKEGGGDPSSRVTYGFRLATSRRPDAREMKTLLSSYEKDRQYFAKNLKEAESVAGTKDPELAAWTALSNALLNLDETLTKE